MKHIRNTLAILLIWFFFFFNIERINEPINLASFVYVYVVLWSLAMLFYRQIMELSFLSLFIMSLPPYFILKWWYGHHLAGLNLPITITEIAAIGLTIFLSRQLARQLNEIGETVSNLIITPLTKGINPFDISQSQIYREIRRARQHKQEVSLLTVRVSEQSVKLNINRFIRDFENEIIQSYVNARIGKLFVEKLHITDIISQRGDSFVILLPETGKEDTNTIINRLQVTAKEKLGITLEIGAATFPTEATTFEDLLGSAEGKMGQLSSEREKNSIGQEGDVNRIVKL